MPDRGRAEHQERRRPPGHRLGTERAQRDQHGERGGRREQRRPRARRRGRRRGRAGPARRRTAAPPAGGRRGGSASCPAPAENGIRSTYVRRAARARRRPARAVRQVLVLVCRGPADARRGRRRTPARASRPAPTTYDAQQQPAARAATRPGRRRTPAGERAERPAPAACPGPTRAAPSRRAAAGTQLHVRRSSPGPPAPPSAARRATHQHRQRRPTASADADAG